VTKLLTDGIASHYPSGPECPNVRKCFLVTETSISKRTNEYIIIDNASKTHFYIVAALLETPSFDLVTWYMLRLNEHPVSVTKQSAMMNVQDYSDVYHYHGCENSHQLIGCAKILSNAMLDSIEASNAGTAGLSLNSIESDDEDAEIGNDDEDMPGLDPVSDSEDEDSEDEDSDNGESSEDIPGLTPVSDSEDDSPESGNPEEGYPDLISVSDSDVDERDGYLEFEDSSEEYFVDEESGDVIAERLAEVLTGCQPFPGDGPPMDPRYRVGDVRFIIDQRDHDIFEVFDRVQGFEALIHVSLLRWREFSVGRWHAERCTFHSGIVNDWETILAWASTRSWEETSMGFPLVVNFHDELDNEPSSSTELNGVQVDRNVYPSLQQNAALVKGDKRILPKPIVVAVTVNGQPA
jgi:hypothetical protein